jgi:hypothetical protein
MPSKSEKKGNLWTSEGNSFKIVVSWAWERTTKFFFANNVNNFGEICEKVSAMEETRRWK